MEEMIQILQSYFRFRVAVLRNFNLDKTSEVEFLDLVGLSVGAKYRRKFNADLWRISEINKLAKTFKLTNGIIDQLAKIAPFVDELPDVRKRILFKVCSLDNKKIRERIYNYDKWSYQDLVKITQVLEGFYRIDSRMAN